MKNKITYLLFNAIFLIVAFVSCNKKDKLQEGVDPDSVAFLVTQPSIASATFVAQCTNYDVRLDSIIFLDPNSLLYYQNMNGSNYEKNEEFMIGGYTSADGIWIIQFRGQKLEDNTAFDVSIPYTMDIEEGDEDE